MHTSDYLDKELLQYWAVLFIIFILQGKRKGMSKLIKGSIFLEKTYNLNM